MYDKPANLQPVVSEPSKPYRHWMRFVCSHFIRPAETLQPRGFAVPERLWQRQSALIMSLHEIKGR